MCGCLLHSLDVQRTMRPAYFTVKNWAGDAMRSKQINIATGRGRKSGVEIRAYHLRPLDTYGGWQVRVNAADPGLQAAFHLSIDMDDLLQSMDSGIGTACADGSDGMREKRRQSRF